MDVVAEAILMAVGRMRTPPRVRLIEEEGGTFLVEMPRARTNETAAIEHIRIESGQVIGSIPLSVAAAIKGSQTELILRWNRFLSRPLELPKRAAEFLDGIVRSQIDRLTPWSQNDAAFGWTAPSEVSKDRISLTVVATAAALIAPYVQAVVALGAAAVAVSTNFQTPNGPLVPIKVLEHKARGVTDIGRVRLLLAALLLGAGLSATVTTGVASFVIDGLNAQQDELLQQIAGLRVLLRRNGEAEAPPAERLLERRKQQTPSSVIVLEALSQILPDNTYVTELRIEGDKLQVIGVTHDAPSLVQLIEQSPHFMRATFFAPTTSSPEDRGERFHIESRIKPVFGLTHD